MKKWLKALEPENMRNLSYVGVDVEMVFISTIDLVREVFGFWKELQGTEPALKKDVLKIFLPIAKPNPENPEADFEDNDEFEWLSVAQLERGRIVLGVVWEDDSNELANELFGAHGRPKARTRPYSSVHR
jgi:hypothetical protein